MEEPILHLSAKKYTEESTVVSMRLPQDMLRDIDLIAKATARSRNEILSLCLEFALQHIQIEK